MRYLIALLLLTSIHTSVVAAESPAEMVLALEQRFNSDLMEKDEAKFG